MSKPMSDKTVIRYLKGELSKSRELLVLIRSERDGYRVRATKAE